MGAAFIGPALEAFGGAAAAEGAAGALGAAATEGLGAAGAAEGAAGGGGLGQALKGLNPAQFLGGGGGHGGGGGVLGAANAGVGFLNAAADAVMSVIPSTDANKD